MRRQAGGTPTGSGSGSARHPFYRVLSAAVNRVGWVFLLGVVATIALAGSRQDRYDAARRDEALLERLNQAFAEGRLDAVVAAFTDTLRNRRLTPRLRNLEGLALAAQGRHREAVKAYERGLKESLDFYELHLNLAHSLRALGITGRALAEYELAAELAPEELETRLAYGRALLHFRRHAAARRELAAASSLSPHDPRVLESLAEWADVAATPQEAVALWRRVEAEAASTRSARRLAELLSPDDPREAAVFYDRCAERDPTALDCLAASGARWLALGEEAEAARRLRAAVDGGFEDPSALHNLLLALSTLGEADSLEAVARRHPPAQASSWGVIALGLRAAGRPRPALRAARRGVELAPDDLEMVNLLAVLLAEEGQLGEARRHWRWILERDPGNANARKNLRAHGAG